MRNILLFGAYPFPIGQWGHLSVQNPNKGPANLYANFRFKVLNSLLEMEGRPRIHHPLSSYLDMTKDKNGMIKTRLKIPYWSRQEPQPPVDLSDEVIFTRRG